MLNFNIFLLTDLLDLWHLVNSFGYQFITVFQNSHMSDFLISDGIQKFHWRQNDTLIFLWLKISFHFKESILINVFRGAIHRNRWYFRFFYSLQGRVFVYIIFFKKYCSILLVDNRVYNFKASYEINLKHANFIFKYKNILK